MKIDLTRRDVLKFGAGAAVGILATPAPWKAIDDLAIWTQNWKWIPVPPKGPVSVRMTTCSLCPAGCAVRARCVAGLPVSVSPASADQPLCPLGLAGHHLPYHPARLTSPVRVVRSGGNARGEAVALDLVCDEVKRTIAEQHGGVAVLDTRPGRSGSNAWRAFLATLPSGTYVPAPGRAGGSLTTLAAMLGCDCDAIAFDAGHARTILSFGAPLAEGWGDPRLMRRLLERDPELSLIQVEPIRSTTAALAERWLIPLPGTEAALALGIANVLITENLVDRQVSERITDYREFAEIVARFTPEAVSRGTRVPAAEIIATARHIAANRPALVVAGEDPAGGRFTRTAETAILGLNILLSSIDVPGGVVHRDSIPSAAGETDLAPATELDAVEDGSVSLLIVDGSEGDAAVPWSAIERKLVPKHSLVVALTPFLGGLAAHATYAIPTPPWLEGLHEVPAPFDSACPTLAVSPPLLPPRQGALDPMTLLATITGAAVQSDDLLRNRIAAIHASGNGIVVDPSDGSTEAVAQFATAGALWDALLSGRRWRGDLPKAAPAGPWSLLDGSREGLAALTVDGDSIVERRRSLVLLARGTRDVTASAALSPVTTKIYQESGLRRPRSTIITNPRTARDLGLRNGAKVKLETGGGAMVATLAIDEAVMPGVVVASAAPSKQALGLAGRSDASAVLDILPPGETWRTTAASVVEA